MYLYRMESREKCEQIISIFNNRALPGSSQPLVVKFADGGKSECESLVPRPHLPVTRNWAEEDRSVQP